jgi:hypothetical protein
MRKYLRYRLRKEAERKGLKPSRYVREVWDDVQKRRYGAEGRAANVAIGTKPKRKWRPGLFRAVRTLRRRRAIDNRPYTAD